MLYHSFTHFSDFSQAGIELVGRPEMELASPNLNWQVSMATELLKARNKEVFIDGFNDEEINLIFDYVCTE